MIKWIQENKWLSSILLASFSLLLFGGLDTVNQGFAALALNFLLALSVLFAATIPIASIFSLALSVATVIYLHLDPLMGGLTAVMATITLAAFSNRLIRIVGLVLSIGFGMTVAWIVAFGSPLYTDLFGLTVRTAVGRISALALIGSLVFIVNIFAYLLGRYSFVSLTHVGTRTDRLFVREEASKLALEIAEQNERFGIARDISELIIQKVAAVISLTEGGQYAARVDPNSASRSLDRIAQSARAAHTELRRLFDMLNKTRQVSAAPPGLRELDALVVLYRELGYNAYLRNEGKPFELNEGAQLALYRIIFDALENVQQNCPIGTDVSIDLSWVEEGMQVLFKDNGIEVANRTKVLEIGDAMGYTAEEDLQSLIEPVVGKGITAMRERAALYAGGIEATKVPGVGFTVSAIFPHLKSLGAEQA